MIWTNEAGNTCVLIGLALFCGMSATLAPEERGVCHMGFITSVLADEKLRFPSCWVELVADSPTRPCGIELNQCYLCRV